MNIHIDTIADELKTLNDLARWAVSQFNESTIFFGHGTNNVWDEAVSLILPTLYLPYSLPDSIWQARLTRSERCKIIELILRRIQERIPTAYLTNTMQFCNLAFYIDERVLVPRSAITELIERGFAPWLPENQPVQILDLCTGSACIAIACAHYLPETIVDAVDISPSALEVAAMNVKKHFLEARVNLYLGDLFEPLTSLNKTYDLIIANPPYVDVEEMQQLPQEYKHEPALGLMGGPDGLDIVKKIMLQAKDFLKPTGVLIVEVGNSEETLVKQFPSIPFTWLEFERGEGGVFLLTYDDLKK